MALVRALNSAISGLRGHQFRIDTIGDNLANSTTTGFKAGRVEFQTMLSQTISFGTAPQGFLGGIDPVQQGLGVAVASTTRQFTQGELEATGVVSDLGIEGDGFFIMTNQAGDLVYSRDGSFTINPANLLHNPANGFIVQGINADLNTFTIASGAPIENISIPIGNLTIAVETGTAVFDGNLNGGGEQALQATVLESNIMVDITTGNAAVSGTALTDLGRRPETPGPDIDLAIDLGDTIYLQAKKGGRTLPQLKFFVGTSLPPGYDGYGTTLQDYLDFVQRALGINPGDGDLLISGMRDSDNNPSTPGVAAAATAYTTVGGAVTEVIASGTDFLGMGVRVNDILRFNTGAGAGQISAISDVRESVVGSGIWDVLVLNTPLTATLPQPVAGDQFTIHERPNVSVADPTLGTGFPTPGTDTDDIGFPSSAGRIRVSGNVGVANNITDLEMVTSDGVAISQFYTRQSATGESIISNATFYDSDGNPHLVEVTYVLETKGGVDPVTTSPGNVFRFFAEAPDSRLLNTSASLEGADRVIGTGTIAFSAGGQFLSQNPGAAFNVQIPNQGAATPLIVSPDYSGLTGFAAQNSAVYLTSQDGFPTGTLTDFSVGEDGVITGIFNNGITRNLGQILLARFANNNGLRMIGENNYQQAANSGIAVISQPGTVGLGAIRSGVLEASNVDFAREFTNLIVSQRAFQANARVITTADDLLEELVNIV